MACVRQIAIIVVAACSMHDDIPRRSQHASFAILRMLQIDNIKAHINQQQLHSRETKSTQNAL
jgi:hypothetical protein